MIDQVVERDERTHAAPRRDALFYDGGHRSGKKMTILRGLEIIA
jgi:hypothetical protein